MTVDIAPVQRTGNEEADETPGGSKKDPDRAAENGGVVPFKRNESVPKRMANDGSRLDDGTPLPEEPKVQPPNRAIRTDTGSSVGQIQRGLLDSFADFTPDNLSAMKDANKLYKAAKLRELEALQVDKDALSAELQDTLVTIADARHAAFHALLKVRIDKQFVQKVLEKYRSLVMAFEEQKMAAEREDKGQIKELRRELAELNEHLRYTQTLSLMMDGLEKTSADGQDLQSALHNYRLDPSVISSAKPHTLAANKAALFGALEGLEAKLMGAKSQSLRRLASLKSHEDSGTVSSELLWLEQQLKATQTARNGMGEDAPPAPKGLNGVDDVKKQIQEVEQKLTELKEGGSGGGGLRPVTAGSDGRDVVRQRAKIQEKLELELAGLRARLGVAEAQQDEEEELDREGLEAQIRVLGEALAAEDEGGGGQSEREVMMAQLEELEELLDGKQSASKMTLMSALRAAEKAASHLIQLSREGASGSGIAEHIARIESTLNRSLITAVDAQQAGLALSSEINLRLSAAGEDVAAVREVYEKAMAAKGGTHDDEEWLREDLAAAQKEKESLDAWAQKASEELFDLEGQMRKRVELEETHIQEPEDDIPPEHTFRAKLAIDQSEDWTPYEGYAFSAADGAEYAMLWGMSESETHLLWIASAALQAPLPPGWRVCQDKMKQAFYWSYGSRVSTYWHPNDTRYKEVFEEMQAYSRSVDQVKLPALTVEAEQKRLQEAAAALEKHQRALKRRKERLSERHEKIAKEASEEEERRKKLENASQAERLSLDVEKMKTVAKQDNIAAKEALRDEVRDQIVGVEGASIRQQILEEEKQKIVLDSVKQREEMMREEEELVMKRMEERSPEEMRDMRIKIRAEQREHLKAIERDKMELEIAASRPPYVSARQRKKDERIRELAAFTASAVAIDDKNRREVEEYGVYLGMDPTKDKHLLWVADMALAAPLPQGWSEHQDTNGNIFFYHSNTQASTYEHPLDATFRQYIAKIRHIAK